jgi:preprotein translocase subunit SecA
MAERDIPIIGFLIKKIAGSRNERFVKRYQMLVRSINARENELRTKTDSELRGRLTELRKKVEAGTPPDEVLVEALATAREAMDRSVGIRNIFNPKHNFDPAQLPPEVQGIYRDLKAQMEATPPIPPTGEWLGGRELIPGWAQVDIPPAVYDAVRTIYTESKPPFRARPFDVQLIGAMVLGQGKIAEMKTGEGKTIVGPLAAYVAACSRWQVHVITVNDYLVQRDRDWTSPFFHAVGMTVGAIHPQHMQDENEKRQMYRCNVVYGTTSEFGFDYLRDNMKRRVEEQVQRKRDFAIVDEVDSTLIDEARTPLIISGAAHEGEPRYELADRLARHLVDRQRPWQAAEDAVTECTLKIKSIEGDLRQLRDGGRKPELQKALAEAKAALPGLQAERTKFVQYYEVKPERKQAFVTHDGISEAQRVAGIGSFYVDQNMDLPHLLEQAIRAHTVYQNERDYIVMDSQDPRTGQMTPSIVIVDTNTGRPMVGRQWSDGLHQAIECKEQVPIKEETQTVATITIQNYFKMYKKLAGMTGTADTEAQEFNDIYKLDVVAIPTNKPARRKDYEHVIYLSAKDKWNAIVDEIKAFHDVGRPMLVGTTNVEKSEMLSKALANKYGIKHETLNAKPDKIQREAEIVEQAGQLGSVMISTNMAGRGTDIKLGQFTREQLLEHWLRRGIAPRTLTIDADENTLREQIYRKIASTELEMPKREAEAMTFPDVELALLRHWALKTTLLTEGQVGKMSADRLRAELDKSGRCLLHRIRWFKDIEEMGGLHVIGTERHESRRIDNQLRGRSGRQGDQGSTRFFVSLEDDITKMFAGETMQNFLAKFGGMKEGVSIEHPWISSSIERVQRKVEEHHFQQRKQLLEYDEVREHHRQRFYGTRQRVLEGRDVKGLLMDWIGETIHANASKYLSKDYPAECAAEHASNVLGNPIQSERLRGKDMEEMMVTIRRDARDDELAEIDRSLGEYMPHEGSDVNVDFDIPGLVTWAKTRFNVDLDPAVLQANGTKERRRVLNLLTESAFRKIERADLSGISTYLAKDYGIQQFASWAKEKFLLDVTADELKQALKGETPKNGVNPAEALILQKAREFYTRKEIDYPIKFAIEMTKSMMQYSPAEAFENLCRWANVRYRLGWTIDEMKKRTPQSMRQDLQAKAEVFVREGELEREVARALACKTDEELEAYIKERFNGTMPEALRYLDTVDRPQAIRSFVENILRSEMLRFERTITLDVMDSAWKDHLYAMDQLLSTIGFRAFSQNDPRIEFKREGSHMFTAALQQIKDRVTDYVFKAELTPQAAPPQGMRPPGTPGMGGAFGPRAMPAPAPRPPAPQPMPQAGGGGFGAASVIGPGFAAGFGKPLNDGTLRPQEGSSEASGEEPRTV